MPDIRSPATQDFRYPATTDIWYDIWLQDLPDAVQYSVKSVSTST